MTRGLGVDSGHITGHSGQKLFPLQIARKVLGAGRRAIRQWEIDRKLLQHVPLQNSNNLADLPDRVLAYTEGLRLKGSPYGTYRYTSSGTRPLLYASVYAALLRHLLGDLRKVTQEQRQEWIAYINSFQSEDGLYRDLLLQNEIAETEDWWGWRHLTAHVVTALTCLGGKPVRRFSFLENIYGEKAAAQWISGLAWWNKPENISNTVMNYGVLLQYERDFNENGHAGHALDEIFAFLDENQDSSTGLWGKTSNNPVGLSIGVQTAYHLLNLYFYDRRPVRYVDRIIDSCLGTQNRVGGYGVALNSSACEDIDSIDPLCRLCTCTGYRKSEIEASLEKALPWIPANQMADGGFVFNRFARFAYGHELMTTGQEESHLFGTWFRTLSLGYISQVLAIPGINVDTWNWVSCPGYQFWHAP